MYYSKGNALFLIAKRKIFESGSMIAKLMNDITQTHLKTCDSQSFLYLPHWTIILTPKLKFELDQFCINALASHLA